MSLNENSKNRTRPRGQDGGRHEEVARTYNRELAADRKLAKQQAEEYDKELSAYRADHPVMVRPKLTAAEEAEFFKALEKGEFDFPFWSRTFLGMRVHPGQATTAEMIGDHRISMLRCANAWGKTTFIAIYLLWTSFYRKFRKTDGTYNAMALGPELRHSLIVHHEIEQIRLNQHAGQTWSKESGGDGQKHYFILADMLIPKKDKLNKTLPMYSWDGRNSDIIFATSKNNARAIEGLGPDIICFDEVRLERALNFVVYTVLVPRGFRVPNFKVLLSSTPLASSIAFKDLCDRGAKGEGQRNGKGGFAHHRGPLWENSTKNGGFLGQSDLEIAIEGMPRRNRELAIEAEFTDSPLAFFDMESVDRQMAGETADEMAAEDFKGMYIPGHRYVGGADEATSSNLEADNSVVTVWDVTELPFRVVFEYVFPKGTHTAEMIDYCDKVIKEFHCTIAYDKTSALGWEFESNTEHNTDRYQGIISTGGKRASKDGTSVPKFALLSNFRTMIDNGQWMCPLILPLRGQIVGYEYPVDKGLDTDRLMAQLNAAWLAKDFFPVAKGDEIELPDEYQYSPEQMGVYSEFDYPDEAS